MPHGKHRREVNIAETRFDQHARIWNVSIVQTLETESSTIGFGTSAGRPVVLKVIRNQSDEWRSGAVLDALAGNGAVRVYEYADGAALLERLSPATPLVELSLAGRDDEATEILCDVMRRLWQSDRTASAVAIQDWGAGFNRYLESGDRQLPRDLLLQARSAFMQLAATQKNEVLLHGDLQHYNVLHDEKRGWLAIDPKGVIGEREYEVGAALRNPIQQFDRFAPPAVIERRIQRVQSGLELDAERMLSWSFAQGVLSAV
ncbi:MAG: aminoglycoside phosphotransferase family protein, partial [Gemmatimonadota bacterium]